MKKKVATRKKYKAPKLTVYGSITELTQASNTGMGDASNPIAESGTST